MSEKKFIIYELQRTHHSITLSILRMILGWTFFKSGAGKLFGWFGYPGIAATTVFFEKIGMPVPDVSAYAFGGIEFICGALLFVGLFTRIAATPLLITIYIALLAVHREAAYHYPILIYASCFVLIQHGGGRFSLDRLISQKET